MKRLIFAAALVTAPLTAAVAVPAVASAAPVASVSHIKPDILYQG